MVGPDCKHIFSVIHASSYLRNVISYERISGFGYTYVYLGTLLWIYAKRWENQLCPSTKNTRVEYENGLDNVLQMWEIIQIQYTFTRRENGEQDVFVVRNIFSIRNSHNNSVGWVGKLLRHFNRKNAIF